MVKSKQWLVKNAVMAWLVNYAEKEAGELTADYQEFYKELENEQPSDTQTRKRGRPAKRQRTQKATSNPSSTKENQTVNQEA